MTLHRPLRLVTIFTSLAFSVLPARAWDGVVTGKIAQIHGVAGAGGAPGNYDLRIYIEGQTTVCSGALDPSWGYINSNDSNYKGLLAMLLMAQATGKVVTLYVNKGPSDYCQIGYISVGS